MVRSFKSPKYMRVNEMSAAATLQELLRREEVQAIDERGDDLLLRPRRTPGVTRVVQLQGLKCFAHQGWVGRGGKVNEPASLSSIGIIGVMIA